MTPFPQGRRVEAQLSKRAAEFLSQICLGYSNIFFISNPIFGAMILGLSFCSFSVGFHGLIAELMSFVFVTFNPKRTRPTVRATPPFNAILCGNFLGFWMDPSLKSVLFLLALGYTNWILHLLVDAILTPRKLPVLSLPFSLTCLTFAPLLEWSLGPRVSRSLSVWPTLDAWSSGSIFWDQVFQSLGSVIFLPLNWVGAFILVLLFLESRVLFLGVLLSLSASWGIHSVFYPPSALGFWNWSHFNFALIGASVGGFFFLPSVLTLGIYLASFWGGLLSYYVLLVLFQYHVEWIHSIPLWCGSALGVFLAKRLKPEVMNLSLVRPMERAWTQHQIRKRRFGEALAVVDLPLGKPCSILQGFNGDWTHQGQWKQALDFVILDDQGKSHRNAGERPEDYHIYGQDVLAPVSGWVVKAHDLDEDSSIAQISFQDNWGNHLLIRSEMGFYVLLAHLKKGSLRVQEGSFVKAAEVLAQVGNSGYSPEPHLHLQVGESADLNQGTIDFSIQSYLKSDGQVCFHSVPAKGDSVRRIVGNQTLQWALNFRASDELEFETDQGTRATLRCGLDPHSGLWFFEQLGVSGRAYFWKDDREFYFYDWKKIDPESFLSFFSLALSRVPFALSDQGSGPLSWKDWVLRSRVPGFHPFLSFKQSLAHLFPFFDPKPMVEFQFQMSRDATWIRSQTDGEEGVPRQDFQVRLDPWTGILSLEVGSQIWRRKKP
ncbi:MAG: urea transporter [Bdellovibrionia bacterium]